MTGARTLISLSTPELEKFLSAVCREHSWTWECWYPRGTTFTVSAGLVDRLMTRDRSGGLADGLCHVTGQVDVLMKTARELPGPGQYGAPDRLKAYLKGRSSPQAPHPHGCSGIARAYDLGLRF